ncbi:MAG: hypothetical protein JXA99_04000 [Candidatus Lokiarchaeota archaeon]|nr:hypothetical protein [Candidatus Lokiarchaeota archaeon]
MKVEVRCPSCEKIGFIKISEDKFANINRGLLAINIAEKLICEHSFIVYVDKNLIVRDCFIADFHIKIPELDTSEELNDNALLDVNKIDLVILRLNFSASIFAYILRCLFLKKKMVFISKETFLFKHLKSLIKYITLNNFDYSIEIIHTDDFFKNMDKYSEYIILEGNKIIQDKDKIINPKDLKVERTIIQKFLSENDKLSSILILRKEIETSYRLAKSVVDFVNTYKGKEIQSKEIIDHLFREFKIEVTIGYLDYIIKIVENAFNLKVPKSSDVSNFLGLF